MATPITVSESDLPKVQQALRRALRWIEGGNGIIVEDGPDGVVISIERETQPDTITSGGSSRFLARVDGSSSIGSNKWSYTLIEVQPDDWQANPNTFQDVPGGRQVTGYNLIEANNDGSGVEGSGDDVADFPSGVSLQPIGKGAVVLVTEDRDCNGKTIYYFQESNNPSGSCN